MDIPPPPPAALPPLPYPIPSGPPEWLVGPTGFGGWLLLLAAQCTFGVVVLLLAAHRSHHLSEGLLDLLTASCDGLLLAMLLAKSSLATLALYARFAARVLVTGFNLHTAYTLTHLGTRFHHSVQTLLLRQAIACGTASAWLVYWHFSRRVRNTYRTGIGPAPPLVQ